MTECRGTTAESPGFSHGEPHEPGCARPSSSGGTFSVAPAGGAPAYTAPPCPAVPPVPMPPSQAAPRMGGAFTSPTLSPPQAEPAAGLARVFVYDQLVDHQDDTGDAARQLLRGVFRLLAIHCALQIHGRTLDRDPHRVLRRPLVGPKRLPYLLRDRPFLCQWTLIVHRSTPFMLRCGFRLAALATACINL